MNCESQRMAQPKARPNDKKSSHSTRAVLACSIGLILLGSLTGCSPDTSNLPIDLPNEHLLSHETYRIASLPTWFAEELFDETQAEDMYANETETVFGLNVSKNPTAVFRDICTSMESKGWIRIESGINHCSTFIRETGSPSWALVSCTSVGNSTCIVACIEEPVT